MSSLSRLFLLACLLGFSGCTDSTRSSTEVDNELKVASVTGIAATGLAMVSAPWSLSAENGIIIAEGVTDSLGQFQVAIDSVIDVRTLPWLLQVTDGTDTLYALLALDSLDRQSGSIFGLVNPVTDFVARQLLASLPAAGSAFVAPSPDSLDARGTLVVSEIFGAGLDWHAFSKDRNYRAAVQNPQNGYVPSQIDLVIHSLSNEALRLSRTRTALMDSLLRSPGTPALDDQSFQLDLASNMVLYGIPPEQARPMLDSLGAGSVYEHYESLWQYHEDNGGDSTGMNQEGNLAKALEVSNQAMQMILGTYMGMDMLAASQNYSLASRMIADEILPRMNNESRAENFWPRLARSLGFVLGDLTPSSWVSDSMSVRSLLHLVMLNNINAALQSPEEIPATTVQQWVGEKWSVVSPAFSKSPIRADSSWVSLLPPTPAGNGMQ